MLELSPQDVLHCASDLHLSTETPNTLRAFETWLASVAQEGSRVLLLGDVFEVWAGDDQDDDCTRRVKTAIQSAVACGCRVEFMHGNRDFLLRDGFADECGMTLLPDPEFIRIGALVIALSHGDQLCTDDVAYQRFRLQSRNPAWQDALLAQPLAARQQLAKSIRSESMQHKASSSLAIQDVNALAVQKAFKGHWPDGDYVGRFNVLVHGHTHRCAVHQAAQTGSQLSQTMTGQLQDGMRLVLPDWCMDAEHDDESDGRRRGGYLTLRGTGAYTLTLFN